MISWVLLSTLLQIVFVFYVCMALYALYLGIYLAFQKKPMVVDPRFLKILFVAIFGALGYYLLRELFTLVTLGLYLLLVLDLVLFIFSVPYEIRIIGSRKSPEKKVIDCLFQHNIPFRQNGSQFDLLKDQNKILITKTIFQVWHISLKKTRNKKVFHLLKRYLFQSYSRKSEDILYRRGIILFWLLGLAFSVIVALSTYTLYILLF